jgi:hypothetical protein
MEKLTEGRIVASEPISIHFSSQLNFVSSWPIFIPEGGIVYGFGLSPVASLQGVVGLGFLGRLFMKNLFTKAVLCP